MCPTVTCILTKIDFYPAWRKIRDLDAEHLRRAGIEAAIMATSAPLRAAAIERNDRALNDESGYGGAGHVPARRAGRPGSQRATLARLDSDLGEVADHLESQLRAELSVLDDPEESARLVRQLEAAKDQAERLRSQAARWQQTLNDGTADLVADVEHDLRARLRELVREADEAVEKHATRPRPGTSSSPGSPSGPHPTSWPTTRSCSNGRCSSPRPVAAHFEQDHREIVGPPRPREPTKAPIDPECAPTSSSTATGRSPRRCRPCAGPPAAC